MNKKVAEEVLKEKNKEFNGKIQTLYQKLKIIVKQKSTIKNILKKTQDE